MPLKFKKVIEETPTDISIYVNYSFDILDRINDLFNKKFDGNIKLLAEKMGKSEEEISKLLNGAQNFTLHTIAKLTVAFGEPIIKTVK